MNQRPTIEQSDAVGLAVAKVHWETDNDGLSAYVITKHRDGWIMRTDAPSDLFGIAERRRWAINEAKRQRDVLRNSL